MKAAISRREFLERSSTLVAGASAILAVAPRAYGYPLDGVMGFQGYDPRQQLAKDYEGTLRTLAGYGYKAIDMVAGPQSKPAQELRQILDSVGMICHNCHFSFKALHEGYGGTIDIARTLGLKSMVCQASGKITTADGWKKMADDLNALGARTKQDGLLTGYHNHPLEFIDVEGQVPWDLLVKGTDPELVKFQIDVGSAADAGKDPIEYLTKYPTHYYSLHARDARGKEAGLATGEGTLDWKKIFTLAKAANIHNYDVETGAAPDQVMEKLRLSAEFLRSFPAI